MKLSSLIAAAGLAVAAFATPAAALDISGAGASFPYPVYAKWAEAFKKETGNGINYQSIGSGGGIKQIKAKTVTFGATDAPLSGEELQKDGLVQFPMVMGGIVPVVNLDGVKPGELVLDGDTLAKIFMGQINNWNDPAIKKLNASINLPSQGIAVVRRSDGSGTTFNFTDYLSKVSADWKSKVGSATAVEWPVGIGAKGNEGVANNVSQTKGSIGYVEYAYAKQNKLSHTKMVNKDGKVVAPVTQSFQAAAANADWNSVPGFGVVLTNEPGADSWPITAATFILVHKTPANAEHAAEALRFFDWAYTKGGTLAEELDYIPMPASVVSTVKAKWASDIKDAAGKPLYSVSN
ncbi:phosphate ABC transporter substrate-binding protein PstS [Chelatococcus asaccharovorans]|uniref:Phosphate-binding protein PstS n=1 Tax=Chelatococcus asaccharovorans TaxID=28210 RepID=A0A2V3UJ05_9HYPH|nr:phosphate ABC transporter substrate-binding protein (PhoT family) [Chelatococcus asaccharovorans]CAH1662647.1 phosphate ABC transporter periplasmic binding protein [Chelatococcus asaccharovorans]CAH1683109.1 phosphate ABC transporter periplasmic binding protein [Chelatococcus asaccharovorans]